MATLRSSMPFRLRQLLSGQGGAPFPSLKESEPPPEIKAFIDRVIKSPLCDIAIPLSGFHWEYCKGNFHHWRPLFLHFDTYFKTYISSRKDLQLPDSIIDDDGPFPKHTVLQILRVMQMILENCHNKSSFGCQEHFKLLLTSTDPEVLVATLETLSALVKINPSKLHVSGKLIGCGSINSCLLSLAQGWGSKEEGLGLFSCVVANERSQEEGLSLFPSDVGNDYDKSQYRLGTTLHYEFHVNSSGGTEQNSGRRQSSDICVIHIPNLHLQNEDDLTILKQCIDQYSVPPENRFSLLTRIRYARSFLSPKTCRLYSRICLLAFIVLVQSNDAHEELASFFANEPDFTNDLIKLFQFEDSAPGSIRTLAMLALGAQLAAYSSSHERARLLSGSSIISSGGNRTVLLSVLQKAVLSLNNSSDLSALSFLDALLQFYLLHVISSSSSGGSTRGSGIVPTLLPLLQDVESAHMGLVCSAVKTVQKLMDYSNAEVSLFKELGGVELLAHRLQIEVHRIIGTDSENSISVIRGGISKCDDNVFGSQKRLIKAFLKALGSATYASASSTRSQNSYEESLPSSLSLIFRNVDKFGGEIYYSAVTVMSEIIHKDPTCFSMLHDLGLPDAFLSSVLSGILPSSKALTCIPSGLGAICLNAKGLEAVKETTALRFLVETFTTKKYLLAMNEGVVPLSNAVEELLRHASGLRNTGIDIIIEIIEKLSLLGNDICTRSPSNVDGDTKMETDSQNKDNSGHEDLLDGTEQTDDGVSNEQFFQLCIFHVMVLVHRVMENSENCRLFVEKKGIEALMKLLLQPSIARSPEGMAIALHSTVVFKGFTQHHSTPLAHAFCSSLRDHLKKALSGFSSIRGSVAAPDSTIFSHLFVVEFLLFLAASKDTRWVTALLAEFGNGSNDVLEDIGRVHQEVLWQIALIDDARLELEDDSCVSSGGSQRLDLSTSEAEEPRFNSFRQFLDPLMRRRASAWSVESQFYDLVSLYRDLGRATGLQHRLGMDEPSNLQLGSGHQLQPSCSLGTGAVGRMEENTRQSCYSSCCDMMRSLSVHISHMFLELGKVLSPSHRRDDSPNVSSSAKSVVSTFASIAWDHLNFAGHVNHSNNDVSISSKCRYLGKVVSFIDSILKDRPESYNPILLNCFFGHGVIQAILTTFEATSQLLFDVSRMPTSPMETDDGNLNQKKDEIDNSWIYSSLTSYGTLLDHLVTSSFIISPFTKHLLCQPITEGTVPLPQDAETFVKVLQRKVLKAVLPIWSHPHFTDCRYLFVTAIISIIRHIYSGVEVKNSNANMGAQIVGPPPDESIILIIIEMGFSRSRAEEALRQVGTNSVEMAMEWLFSHPEEAQEDDELARALAMSLGSSGTTIKDEEVGNVINLQEEETVQLPTLDELLLTCTRLLRMMEPIVFPVRDLLVMMCSQNDGHHRSKVVTFFIEQVKVCSSASDINESKLSAYLHVLALVLHEDPSAREVAAKNGLVKISLDLLSGWIPVLHGVKRQVPKWLTTAFLALERMLQVDPKLSSEIPAPEQLKKDDVTNKITIVSDENKSNSSQSTLGLKRFIDANEQKRLIEIACGCIQNELPSETMHVVLQLCASLTKVHSIALTFLDAGGLRSLLSLPMSSLFSGFDNVSSAIVRHILEDPQTLQQAMEAEIRHVIVSAPNRHPNGRLTPRNFLQNLASVISRDPVVFMKAAQSVCQIEMAGERPHIVLLKDREKDKCKEKDKEKSPDKDKHQVADANDHGKPPDSSTKNVKAHRKPPQSFVSVIELLLDFVINFVPSPKDDGLVDGQYPNPSTAEMEVDSSENKGKGVAIGVVSEGSMIDKQEASSSLAKTVFVLKLLSEILSTYASSVHVLLRRDGEFNNRHYVPHHGPSANCSAGIFHHILHKFVPYPGRSKKDKKVDCDWRHKLASRASQFLVTSSTRSTEGRRRVFMEISNVLNDFVDSANDDRVPDYHIHAYVDLLNDILTARLPTGPFISAEASAIFIDVGLVRSLTRTLQVLDLDLADSHKIVTGIVKALELVTKEYVLSPDACSGKGVNSVRPTSNHGQPGGQDNGGDRIQSLGTTSRSNQNEVAPDSVEPSDVVQTRGSSGSVTDDMEQERDINGGFPPETDDDFMHEASEEAGGIHNGVATVEIGFDIAHNVQGNSVDEDDDEEMSGEEEDEDEVDEEENNDLDEDDAHHMSHLDTDQDEHEIDEDDYDEDLLEDEDEDDEDDENGVILRLEEGINGIDVLDHIRVYGRENHLLNDPSYLMPEELLGSRRHGRTTSIYSLLGRNSDSGAPLQHQLLVEPSSLHPISLRQSGDAIFRDGSLENTSSRLDSVFRSLRSGRHGHRFNTWVDDGLQRSGSNVQQMPPGMEELLISQLRRPAPGQPLNQDKPTAEPQDKVEMGQLWESSEREEAPAPSNLNGENVVIRSPTSAVMDSTGNADVEPIGNEFIRGREVSNVESQATDMQYDRNDAVVRDAEAVSQGSSGSGATLGESLRSLEVEIGSADGHDDGGERPLGDLQPTRMRRVPVSLGNATPVASRDVSRQSVNEVPPHPNQVVDQSGSAEDQQINRTTDSGSIDPAFLDALPEELRAEVISAQQSQAAEPSTDPPQSVEEIDPEFLAALPSDIRAEVLAQQQAQRLQQSQEFEGQPVEMDTVSIIATFPSDLREEVLLTSSDAILANLTPALVAEANMLRERVAHRYHSRALLGMYHRNRRGESSRRDEAVRSGLDRAGTIGPHRSVGGKLSEADGVPLVDNEALRSMIRLLRVVQLPYKSQLQKLFLNLCAHPETRTSLVQILMDMLILDILGPFTASNGALEPSYRLYGRQNSVAYSRPQFFDGLPPLVSRRILESLYYLARSHPEVARLLLHLQLPRPPVDSPGQMRGKAVVAVEHDQTETKEQKGEFSIVLLLNLLNQPLYLRSSAHLEQLLYLLGVVIDNAKRNSSLSNKSVISPSDQPSGSQSTKTETSLNAGTVGTSAVDVKSSGSDDHNSENDTLPILLSLPQTELRLLCSLLARESLSENAYNLVAEVLKKLVTIAPRHCHLFITELADSVQSLSRSAMNELHTYGEGEKELLSTSSTDGTAILRVLQALSALVSILVEKQNEKEPHLFPDVDYKSILSQVWSINSVLEPLWTELSTCISRIESCSDFAPGLSTSSGRLASTSTDAVPLPVPPGTQNILPYIESFFVTCGKLCPGQSVASHDLGTANTSDVEDATTAGGQKFPGSTTRTDEKHVAFVKFSEKHRKLLNAFIRQNPGLLDKSLVLMLKVPRLIDFDNKRSHFRSKMRYQHDHHHNPLRISVRRAYILEDSYNQLRLRSAQDLKGRLTVHFQGEEGIDAGGLTREWYQSLSRVIFDKGALLFTTVGNESTFQPNPNSVYQTEHLSYFKFVGRVVGKALFDGQLLDVHFTRSFYKHILGVKVTYHDIEAIDPHYFRNLKWMLENDVSDDLDLTFSIDADEEKLILYERAEVTDYELIPGGRNIKVTEENKHEYVNLVTEHRLTTAIRPQINAFMEGFNELILQDLISIFNDKELELLVSGLPDIDLDDMRANTEYSGYSAASPVIQWFWEVVQGFTKEDKARLLQFVTGTSKVPLEGFSALQGISGSQRFQIHKAYGSPNHLPSAHTCFNQLDLPEYPSKNQLQERLLLAIHEASEGFGFG